MPYTTKSKIRLFKRRAGMKRLALVAAVVAVAFAGTTLHADSIIDFTINTFASGSISFSPTFGNPHPGATGSVAVANVSGMNTPLNSGATFPVLNGLLTFVTGNLTGYTSTQWLFGGGGAISLTGCVDVNNDGRCESAEPQGTLLTGTFNGADVTIEHGANPNPRRFLTFKTIGGAFTDTKNRALQLLFFPGFHSAWSGDLGINFSAPGSQPPPLRFASSLILGGDVQNTAVVPEPATLTLLGMGLLGISLVSWRLKRVKG